MLGKWIYLGQRNPRLSREQFVERWLNHRRIGVMPAMAAEFVGATYCAVREAKPGLDMLSDEYDGLGLFPLNGLYSIPLIAKTLKQDYIQADEQRFFNRHSEEFSLFGAENMLRKGPDGKALAVQFLRRGAEVSPRDFAQQWQDAGATFCGNANIAQGLCRYIHNTVVAPPPPGFGYDGVAELWFDSLENLEKALADINTIMADLPFIDSRNSFFVHGDIVMSRPRGDA
ncbi:MAG: EthD domain-containing protein [Porticoccaceae bacterium]